MDGGLGRRGRWPPPPTRCCRVRGRAAAAGPTLQELPERTTADDDWLGRARCVGRDEKKEKKEIETSSGAQPAFLSASSASAPLSFSGAQRRCRCGTTQPACDAPHGRLGVGAGAFANDYGQRVRTHRRGPAGGGTAAAQTRVRLGGGPPRCRARGVPAGSVENLVINWGLAGGSGALGERHSAPRTRLRCVTRDEAIEIITLRTVIREPLWIRLRVVKSLVFSK